ncbi:Polymerase/histidinol phosphatase-like protein [Syncephalastrum racemosum]|uniref:Histidinol-phosphatase n=1 Tax=Syncephalastrum racemosum TaxID=13706 RepID=A0A1X2H259_SYNRA|nr:Polymerase/histidinol phosphatase-like protein [Syncephalastrum racemosum]
MPFSYHSHSGQYCHHGYGLLEDVVKEAIRKGFKAYGLSEHMPRYTPTELYPEELEANCDCNGLVQQYAQFLKHARQLQIQYQDKIALFIGTEIEFIHPGYADHVAELRNQVDYVVGSLHHVGTVPIDFSKELYEKALESHGNHVDLYSAYFDEQWTMLQTVKPEVVGHFDLVRIFAKDQAALHHPSVWNKIERNVDFIVEYGGLFEINSRAWKKGLEDAYPQSDIIKLIQSKGGRFTLSDDCHGPNDVGLFYDQLRAYLERCDIHTIHYLARDASGRVSIEAQTNVCQHPFWNGIQTW